MCTHNGLTALGKVKEVLARLQKCEPAATTDKGAEAAGKEEKKKTKKKKKEEEERKETQQQEEEEEKKTAHQEAQRAVGNKEQLTACLLEDKPAAPAADDTSPQTASTAAAGLVGLCLGASQDKNNDPAARARKGGDSDDYSPLEKVRTDVKVREGGRFRWFVDGGRDWRRGVCR